MSVTYQDRAIAEGLRLVHEIAPREGWRVRSWARGGVVTIAVEGATETGEIGAWPTPHGHPVTWVGRGASIVDALAHLGEWEAF